MRLNAVLMFVASVTSAIAVLATPSQTISACSILQHSFQSAPIFPLNIPCRARNSTSCQNFVDSPNNEIQTARPIGAKRRMGRRPHRSDARAHQYTANPSDTKLIHSYPNSIRLLYDDVVYVTHNDSGVIPRLLFVSVNDPCSANELRGERVDHDCNVQVSLRDSNWLKQSTDLL